ncbi:reverse transcriptase-like protein [Citricoccus nitrophenolicus]|uniref:Putative phosphoglycerate mutase n=1 Tax=Citricoccus muralis TaxID=169134 RepID=A0A3D9LAV1_9MICC|nr:reverse transcriptase-like protein [Citricoccus muralis]REE02814.1 putative phosphoglycerate mutase [Citricoccus muralis]
MPQQSTPSTGRLLYVEADGGSRGNPGVAGYGALVRDPDTGAVLDIDAQPLGRASNNVAEYSGMIAGLRMARQIDPDAAVHVRLDSKLVVEQMSGRWKIKHADMQKLAAEARDILPAGQVTYEWIPRAKNKDADLLSNEAMDAGAAGTEWVKARSGIKVTGGSSNPAPAPAPSPASAPSPAATHDAGPFTPGARAPEPDGAAAPAGVVPPRRVGRLHHVEIWVEDLEAARSSLGWLFQELGYAVSGEWSEGTSYQGAGEYLVLESGPHVRVGSHDRLRPGLNHVAFHAGSRADVDALTEAARSRGFTLMFADRHPFAGGRNHYAAYLEAPSGFEVELVAEPV